MSTTEYIVRKEGTGTYGLGEVVADGCTLFRSDDYGLTKEELDRKIALKKSTPKP
jgi:hypothetical protein